MSIIITPEELKERLLKEGWGDADETARLVLEFLSSPPAKVETVTVSKAPKALLAICLVAVVSTLAGFTLYFNEHKRTGILEDELAASRETTATLQADKVQILARLEGNLSSQSSMLTTTSAAVADSQTIISSLREQTKALTSDLSDRREERKALIQQIAVLKAENEILRSKQPPSETKDNP